jgi:hypothetical protein
MYTLEQDLSEIAGKLVYNRFVTQPAPASHDVAIDFLYPFGVQQQAPTPETKYAVIQSASAGPGSGLTANTFGVSMFLCTPDMRPQSPPGVPNIFQANGAIDPIYLGPKLANINLGPGGSFFPIQSFNSNGSPVFPLVVPPDWFVRFATANAPSTFPPTGFVLEIHLAYWIKTIKC